MGVRRPGGVQEGKWVSVRRSARRLVPPPLPTRAGTLLIVPSSSVPGGPSSAYICVPQASGGCGRLTAWHTVGPEVCSWAVGTGLLAGPWLGQRGRGVPPASQRPSVPGADTADEPAGAHPEAAAEGLRGGESSPVTRWGPCSHPRPPILAGRPVLSHCHQECRKLRNSSSRRQATACLGACRKGHL